MEIREATDADIPEILKVLKASLGETSSKKSEEVWRYKHIDNPFGKSLVLVAEEQNEIIGVRAFMRWRWQRGNQIFSAFRAVDTATHPEHRGKGIFKKLTLKALEIGKQNGNHFVFNTPNEQSKPGYLKMGWEEVAKLRVGIKVTNPFYWKKRSKSMVNFIDSKTDYHSLEYLTKLRNQNGNNSNKLFTPKTSEFLQWRYENNPLQDYMVKSSKYFFITGYVKVHSKFRELRIVEAISVSSDYVYEVNRIIKIWARESGVQIISFACNDYIKFKLGFSGNFGPVLTLRNINLEDKFKNDILILDNWKYSLGDLELF